MPGEGPGAPCCKAGAEAGERGVEIRWDKRAISESTHKERRKWGLDEQGSHLGMNKEKKVEGGNRSAILEEKKNSGFGV